MTTSLVVQTSFLGDMVLTTPLIARLAERGPVDVVCTPAAGALLANNPQVRDVIAYDKRGADRGFTGMLRLARTLRASRYDAAYHAQGSARSGALSFMARIPVRVGFASSAGRTFYTEKIPPIDNIHHAARLLSLAAGGSASDLAQAKLRPRLYPGAAERAAVDALLSELNAGRSEQLIALAPGSVWATKRWPYYAELAERLRDKARLVVIGGAADGVLAHEIVSAAPRSIDATGRLSLLASAELIGRAALLVTNDSAPQHLASAMNTPTLTIFGPTVPEFGFGPLADRSIAAGRPALACRPCDRHGPQRCPLGHWKCMREVTADEIAAMVRDIHVAHA